MAHYLSDPGTPLSDSAVTTIDPCTTVPPLARVQRELFITESVVRLTGSRRQEGDVHREAGGFDVGCSGVGGSSPHLWQDTNAGLVERKVIGWLTYR